MTAPDDQSILGWPAVHALTGLSRSTVHRLRYAGSFPEPVRLSPNRVGWRMRDVAAWLAALPAREA